MRFGQFGILAALDVDSRRDSFEVRRVDTCPIPTKVVELKPRRYGSVDGFIDHPVQQLPLSINGDACISLRQMALPDPTPSFTIRDRELIMLAEVMIVQITAWLAVHVAAARIGLRRDLRSLAASAMTEAVGDRGSLKLHRNSSFRCHALDRLQRCEGTFASSFYHDVYEWIMNGFTVWPGHN